MRICSSREKREEGMKTLYRLFRIEFILAVREFSGVLFGMIMPAGIIVLLGIIYGDRPAFAGAGYTLLQQALPAVATVGICATGLMGIPLTISAYREKKILKRFRVTPTSPGLLLGAQVLSNLVFSLISGLLVFMTAAALFNYRLAGSPVLLAGSWLLVTSAVYSIGMLTASVSGTMKTANLLTTIIYFPMLFLSGATIPYEIMPDALQKASSIMPLTQGIILLKSVSLGNYDSGIVKPVIILSATAVICGIAAVKTFRWE